MLRASVIVPARNAAATLPRALDALTSQELEGEHEVIVVDDGSSDGTSEVARAAGGPITVIEQPALGPAAARNRGVGAARASALAFCDADVYPTSGWLAAGLDALESSDIVQGKVLPDPAAVLGPFDRTIWITSEVGLFETANLFVRRELFDRVGGFEAWIHPRVGKPLAEDVWFGYRAKRLGASSRFCEGALSYHAVFCRSPSQYVIEQLRRAYFPAMAGRMPELRRTFLYRRIFLDRRSARFDLAVLGAVAAATVRSPIPAAVALPYLRIAWRQAQRTGAGPSHPAMVIAVDAAADAAGLLAMVAGSARYRSIVI